ncbi:gamma-glutamyltransferase family protein [Aeromicrobium sp. CF3.5]|uniref:gamma-glutamyltransferase family protein n=1 Tax=Aeromicrobium sp. CF3.5 TaxID=3373078 RepID=UPI003EE4AD55
MQRRWIAAGAAGVAVAVTAGVLVFGGEEETAPRSAASPETTAPPEPPEPHVEAAITVDPAATEAAMDVLAEGGTAADAVVAAAAVLSVVEPHYSNLIGAETSALWFDAEDDQVRSLDAVGTVGSEYDRGDYVARGAASAGLYQSLVPGAWDGYMVLLAEEGTLGLDRLLQPAIDLASGGFEASADLANQLAGYAGTPSLNAAAASVYAPGGQPVQAGQTVVQEDFAATLQTIADTFESADDRESGLQAARDLVYDGVIGEALVDAIQADGGYVTTDDMAGFEAEFVDPITVQYDDMTVHQTPPNTQGLTMLTALNTLSNADLSGGRADPDVWQLTIEALKLALADREEFVGDPEFTDVPVDELLAPEYGESQLARIDLDSSMQWPIADGLNNTTTFQVVDGDGNAAAVTTSTGFQLTAAADTGIMLGSRMRYMEANDEGSPNFIRPGAKVRYTGNPWMATNDDGLSLLGGNIGGDTQAQVQTQHFLNIVEFGMTPAEAVAAPRFVSQTQPNSVAPHRVPNTVRIEDGTPADVLSSLRSRGQNLEQLSGRGPFGTGSVIGISPDGRTAELGTDPRAGGTSTGDSRLTESS